MDTLGGEKNCLKLDAHAGYLTSRDSMPRGGFMLAIEIVWYWCKRDFRVLLSLFAIY